MEYRKLRCSKCGEVWVVSVLWKNKKGYYLCPKCSKGGEKK